LIFEPGSLHIDFYEFRFHSTKFREKLFTAKNKHVLNLAPDMAVALSAGVVKINQGRYFNCVIVKKTLSEQIECQVAFFL